MIRQSRSQQAAETQILREQASQSAASLFLGWQRNGVSESFRSAPLQTFHAESVCGTVLLYKEEGGQGFLSVVDIELKNSRELQRIPLADGKTEFCKRTALGVRFALTVVAALLGAMLASRNGLAGIKPGRMSWKKTRQISSSTCTNFRASRR